MKHFPRLAIFICWLVAFLPRLGAFTPSTTDSDIRWQVGVMVESFTPNAFGEPQTIGSSGSLGYNERGEAITLSTPSDSSSVSYYRGGVTLEEHTAGVLAGQSLVREYDDHDRLKTIKLPGDVSISYTYNEDCTLNTVTTAGGVGGIWSNYDPVSGNAKTLALGPLTASSEYNGLEQLLSHSNAITGHTYVYDDYRYDGDGHCYYRNTPNGSCTYEYDDNGWLDDASNPHFHYTKDEVGRLMDTNGSGGYAEDYRPKKRLNSTSVEIFGSVAPGTGSSVAINNSAVTVDTTTGLYNQVYTAGTGWSLYTVRGTVGGAGNGGSNAVAEQSYQVYQPPAVEDLGYDASGNRSQDARWSYSWNDRDQLTWITEGSPATGYQSTNVYCAYDVLGRRVEKKVENGTLITKRTTTLWDGWLPMLDIDYDGAGAETARRYYSWGPDVSGKLDGAAGIGGLLEIMEIRPGFSPTVSLAMNDGIGNVIGLVDETSGVRVASYQYGPFGELVNAYGERAGSCPFRFQTKRYDEETGLYYFGKRYYDPKTQAWLSRDPLREGGGINLYAYCSNDPVGNFDPVGLANWGFYKPKWYEEVYGFFNHEYVSAKYSEASYFELTGKHLAAPNSFDRGTADAAYIQAYENLGDKINDSQAITDLQNKYAHTANNILLNQDAMAKIKFAEAKPAFDLIEAYVSLAPIGIEATAMKAGNLTGSRFLPHALERGSVINPFSLTSKVRAPSLVEQGRNALGRFTAKVGGEVAPGSTAVRDFIQNATQNGWTHVDTEVSFPTPVGLRRYDTVLTDPNGVNWGFEIKSSEGAFSRWDAQQFSADRWINMNGGATAVGKQSGLQISGAAKVLWPNP